MRGSPLLRAIVVIAVLLLAAIPIWKMTHQAAASMDLTPASPAGESPVGIELSFAHAPLGFQVLHLGKVVWEAKQPGETAQKDFDMQFPKEGIDLEVKAEWLPGTPLTAVRMKVTHGYGSTEQTVWGKEKVDKVLTFTDPQ